MQIDLLEVRVKMARLTSCANSFDEKNFSDSNIIIIEVLTLIIHPKSIKIFIYHLWIYIYDREEISKMTIFHSYLRSQNLNFDKVTFTIQSNDKIIYTNNHHNYQQITLEFLSKKKRSKNNNPNRAYISTSSKKRSKERRKERERGRHEEEKRNRETSIQDNFRRRPFEASISLARNGALSCCASFAVLLLIGR